MNPTVIRKEAVWHLREYEKKTLVPSQLKEILLRVTYL
jgi:hypothetical protein